MIYPEVGCVSTRQQSAYLTALLVVKSNDHDMQHRSLHLVSALRLHSFPMSEQRCTALASVRCSHSQRNRVFFSHGPRQSDTVITRPLLRSLPLRPTAPNMNCVKRVISTHFRVRWLSSSTTMVDGDMEPFKALGGRKYKSLIFPRVRFQLELDFRIHV